jgi:uncharacterized protein YjbI with pentapeptide repeats
MAVDGGMDLDQLVAGGSIFMRSTERREASFQDIILRSATVSGNVELAGGTFRGNVTADRLSVGGALLLQPNQTPTKHQASFAGVRLLGARVASNAQFTGATFNGDLDANSITVCYCATQRFFNSPISNSPT